MLNLENLEIEVIKHIEEISPVAQMYQSTILISVFTLIDGASEPPREILKTNFIPSKVVTTAFFVF